MLGAARGYAIGKFGEARLAHEMDVLDFQVARRPAGVFEQKIDPRIQAIFHFAPDRRVVAQLRDQPGLDDLGHQHVGLAGIDADELETVAEIGFDQLPVEGQLAQRIFRIGQPDARKRPVEAGHGARIGDMDGEHLAVFKHHVGEKALVAAGQHGRDQRGRETHGRTNKPSLQAVGRVLCVRRQDAILPPNSSSIWTRMISSNEASA